MPRNRVVVVYDFTKEDQEATAGKGEIRLTAAKFGLLEKLISQWDRSPGGSVRWSLPAKEGDRNRNLDDVPWVVVGQITGSVPPPLLEQKLWITRIRNELLKAAAAAGYDVSSSEARLRVFTQFVPGTQVEDWNDPYGVSESTLRGAYEALMRLHPGGR